MTDDTISGPQPRKSRDMAAVTVWALASAEAREVTGDITIKHFPPCSRYASFEQLSGSYVSDADAAKLCN